MRNLFIYTLSAFLLVGCGGEPVVENEDPVENIEKQVVEEVQEEVEDEEISENLPEDVVEKGYVHLADSKINESETYKYEIYTDRGECTSGYLNDNVPIHCLLLVMDLSDESVVLEVESDDQAVFEVNGEKFAAPSDWYDDKNLLIEWGFGDGGISRGEAKSYNVEIDEFTKIYKSSSAMNIGNLITVGNKQLLFYSPYSEESPQVVVYEILDPIEDVWEIYVDADRTEVDLSKGRKINEMPGVGWVYYRIGKGVVVYKQDDYHEAHESYIYDIDSNEFIPYEN